MLRPIALIALTALLAACQASSEPEVRRAEPAPVAMAAPMDQGAGCWAIDTIPAQTHTVFDTDASGTRRPRDEVLRPAEDRRFAVPCAEEMTAGMIASLQRALAARGHYAGPVTGSLDAATTEGVRRFQAPLGLDSGILTLDAARMLGLVAVGRMSL